jgi:hypothetical protein
VYGTGIKEKPNPTARSGFLDNSAKVPKTTGTSQKNLTFLHFLHRRRRRVNFMSSTIDIVFDRKVAGYEPDDRCSLAYVFFDPEFEELARRVDVVPLKAFYSDDPKSLDWQIDDPVDRERLKKELGPARFFRPSDCLISVTAMRDQLKNAPLSMTMPGRDLNCDLLKELAEVEQALYLAEAQGAEFYFVIGL